jgi:hypothetical protein
VAAVSRCAGRCCSRVGGRTRSGQRRKRPSRAGEDPSLRGRESAQPARHTDLQRRRLPLAAAAARGSSGLLSRATRTDRRWRIPVCLGAAVASGRPWSARALRGRPLRVASSDRARVGPRASSISSCSTGYRSAPGRSRNHDLPPAISRALSAATSTTSAGWRDCTGTRSRRDSSRRRSSATAGRPRM